MEDFEARKEEMLKEIEETLDDASVLIDRMTKLKTI